MKDVRRYDREDKKRSQGVGKGSVGFKEDRT
jgi:hypothetical protein